MPIDITALLKDWGITVGLLAVAATCLCVILVISLREFAFWFLRTHQILKNQNEILKRLENLQAQSQMQALRPPAVEPPRQTPQPPMPQDVSFPEEKSQFPVVDAEPPPPPTEKFRLDS